MSWPAPSCGFLPDGPPPCWWSLATQSPSWLLGTNVGKKWGFKLVVIVLKKCDKSAIFWWFVAAIIKLWDGLLFLYWNYVVIRWKPIILGGFLVVEIVVMILWYGLVQWVIFQILIFSWLFSIDFKHWFSQIFQTLIFSNISNIDFLILDGMVYRVFRRSQFPWLKKLGTDGHTFFLVFSSWKIFGAICGNLNF